jgi:LysR family transcriptional regulator, low CO2-responsive transcriptional regulator
MAKRPDLKTLSLYLAVLDRATMTAAAEAVNLSQPAISTRIKQLETFYGSPLLERRGRRVNPTEAGLVVASYARRVLALVDELGDAVADLDGLRAGRLEVGASASVGETLLPGVFGRFRKAYPGVEIALRIGNSREILRAIDQRELQFGVVGRSPERADLEVSPVIEDRIELCFASGEPLPRPAPMHVADLMHETFVMREQGSATLEHAQAALARVGCSPHRVVHFGSNEAVKRAVAAGLGVGILSMHTLDVDLRAGALQILPCVDWHCRRQFWFVRHRDHHATRAERTFFALLAESGRGDLEGPTAAPAGGVSPEPGR